MILMCLSTRADNSHMNTDIFSPQLAVEPSQALLPHWGVIRATGADAAAFLHGQITHDVALLPEGQARYAAYCNAQGRMQANFLVWKRDQEIWIAAPASSIESLIKRWRMFVLRAKCTFEDLSSSHAVMGVWGAMVADWAGPSVWAVRHMPLGMAVRVPDAHLGEESVHRALVVLNGPPPPQTSAEAANIWDCLDIQAGLPWVTPATANQLVPQMVNMESLDGVSFKKGCYPGQEVVARSQFRGAIKRRGERIRVNAPIQAGQEVFANGQAVGVVVNAAQTPEGVHAGFVSVHVGESDGHALHIGAVDGPEAQRLGLPYPLLTDL